MNNLLALATLVACGSVLSSTVLGEPMSTTAQPANASDTTDNRNSLELRRAPVPLVRNVRSPAPPPTSPEVPAPKAEQTAQDELDRKAAKAAAELDGYKRVNVLSKTANGAWRAKAYRGNIEVRLTVDGTGRVSLD